MSERANFSLLPYSYIVGQDTLRWLLEVAYVMGSSVGGVLVIAGTGRIGVGAVRFGECGRH